MQVAIRKLEARHALTENDRAALQGAFSHARTFEAGQNVLTEGEPPSFVGALLQGVLCRQKSLKDGRRQILAFPLPGDIFDLHSFVLDRMDHSVTAVTRCKVATASRADIEALAEDHPRLSMLLWRDAVVESSVFREWIVNTGCRSAYARMAHLFCELFLRMKDVGLAFAQSCSFPVTQATLAEATGLSVVHVNRVLKQLRGEHLISLTGGRLTIHNWEGLAEAGGFDPAYLHLGKNQALPEGLPFPMTNGWHNGSSDHPPAGDLGQGGM